MSILTLILTNLPAIIQLITKLIDVANRKDDPRDFIKEANLTLDQVLKAQTKEDKIEALKKVQSLIANIH